MSRRITGSNRMKRISMRRMIWWFLAIVAVGFVAGSAVLYFAQSRLIFFPTREITATPSTVGIAFEDVYITVEDGQRVNGWYVAPPGGSTSPVVLYCHGNGGNISYRVEVVEFYHALGAGVLLFDYRGYGRSDGSPGEKEVYADALACYDWVVKEMGIAGERIVAVGQSLGGAVATHLASKRPCRGLIVESSFTSLADIGRKVYPVFPVKMLLRYKFATDEKINMVNCPVLVTHSPDDEMIPVSMGRALYEAAGTPKRFVLLSGDHNSLAHYRVAAYRDAVQEVLSGAAHSW